MKTLAFLLVMLLCSPALAQWQWYTPIEQSRSYQVGGYHGPVYPAYGYSLEYNPYARRYYYVPPVIRVQVSQDPLDPLYPSRFYRRGW